MTAPPPIPGSGLRRNLPVFLSGLVYPGVGQMAQGKWIWGLLLLGGFSGLMLPALYLLISATYTNLQNVIHYDLQKELIEPPMRKVFFMLGGAMLIYFINVADAWRRAVRTFKSEHSMPPTPR